MAYQFINSPESDFSLGIDARSSENQVSPGFVRDITNGDIVEKRARKRVGYQGYGGNLPVRVTSVSYDDSNNSVCFTLDSSVSLQSVGTSPIVVYGKSSTFSSGPFTTAGSTAHYYSSFTVPTRKVLTAPSGTLTISGEEHSLATTDLFVSIVESTSLSDLSWSAVFGDSLAINETTYDVTVPYVTYADTRSFVYYAEKQTVPGTSYVATIAHGGTGSETTTITAATHDLSNYNIVVQVQRDTGTTREQVQVDSLVIAANGDVSVTIVSSTAATFYVLLSAPDVGNTVSGPVAAGTTTTLTIASPESPWLFYSVYLEQTPGGVRELVLPDSVTYDGSADTVVFSLTNGTASAVTIFVYYEYGDIRAHQLCVTDASVVSTGTDGTPQMSIWGLDWNDLYSGSKQNREGWVTHVDTYRRSAEQRLVSGIGGNLLTARTASESGTEYLYATLYPNLFGRVSTNVTVGPLFWDTGDSPGRTRGYITSSASATGWAVCTAVEFDMSNGWTKYTVSLPSKAILDSAGVPTTLSSVISTTSGIEDWLTVQQMSYGRHNGTFKVRQVADGTDSISVWVENSDNSEDYNDSGTAGQVAIFTEHLPLTATSPFLVSDSLVSPIFGETTLPTVLGSSGTTVSISQIVSILTIPAGLVITGSRTSSLVPMRLDVTDPTSSVLNLVRGDMLSYTGIPRLLRVLSINSDSDRAVSISVSSGIATVTLGSGDTTFLSVGSPVLLLASGVYTGSQIVASIPNATQFTFETTEIATGISGTLKGNVVEVDEQLPWQDSATDSYVFSVGTRWIPVEAPTDSYGKTPDTYVRHFTSGDFSNQPFLRSTTVTDNMYLTNGADEVHKFDGTSLYRAGLPSWQPGLFVTQESTGATIVSDLRSLTYSAISAANGQLTITASGSGAIPVDTPVRLTGSTKTYTVREYTNDATNFYLFLDRALDGSVSASGTASEIGVYRYYYRLNLVDANRNVVMSAVTGYQDHVVEVTGNVGIRHRLIGLPPLGNYDYDRIEVQIYRTQMNQPAPFYLVTTLPVDFDNTQGYIDYLDSFADSDLTSTDKYMVALKGTELGTSFSDPLRAKYVTSIGNRLVLGNVRDYPELDIQIVGDANISNSTFNLDNFLFRKDNTDTGTTTDMVNRVRYQWINSATAVASGFSVSAGVSFSFTTANPTLASPGDWIYLSYSSVATTGRSLAYAGLWQIASVSGTTVTVNLTEAATASSYPDRYTIADDPTDVPVLLGVDGNLGQVNGDSFDTFDAMRRMSMAINCSMTQTDVTLSGYEQFTPWLVCRGGNDTIPAGRLVVRSPLVLTTTPELVPTFSGYSLFVNQIQRSTGSSTSASTRVFPSRVLISYENFPEIFDAPTVLNPDDSQSAIDINSADGQEITGIIPFFGESAFGAAQQAAILVVFKSNSIYLVDVASKKLGNTAIQRIETEGLGCTAPYSIAVTRNGIVFANESGIYCLRKDQSIQYLGKYMERNWTEKVSLSNLEQVHGHHYGLGRAYKLSVPYTEDVNATTGYVNNSRVYVYNHTGELSGGGPEGTAGGAWTQYDNHPAIGWANLGSGAFFATTEGRIFSLRDTGTSTDYRDDNGPVAFSLETRATDVGNGAIRKLFDRATVHYRLVGSAVSVGTSLSFALDLATEYTDTTPTFLGTPNVYSGLSSNVNRYVYTISHSMEAARGAYLAIQIANGTLDEGVEIAGIDLRVAGLETAGIKQAGQTSSSS